MIAGRVNDLCEAVLRLVVVAPGGQQEEIVAVIDTGFNGYLTLPPHLVSSLKLPFRRHGRVLLGDREATTVDIHEAVVLWDGQERRITVDAADTEPLLGMGLLYGYHLGLEVVEGGRVDINSLPSS